MRTTVDLDEDVLAAAKELARIQNVAVGRVISRLMREALIGTQNFGEIAGAEIKAVGGFRPFAARGVLVSNDKVNELRKIEGV
ncbi:MAG: hypothetical protein BVN35_15340 [Proteobacteria bacterium ST_bin11]|nr:MAG: hypothetical protein BVN35_15340 [Proteobacteria bacterium ST_bin11]